MENLRSQVISVKCPKCDKESEFTIYRNINATEENGLAGRIRDGSLFLHYCPHCSQKIQVEYSFVYHQVEDHFLVHYCVSDDEADKALKTLTSPESGEEKATVAKLIADNTIIRIVRSRQQLLEKMCIYDAGMDDRVIEIMKFFVAGTFTKDNPDKKISNLLFNVITNGRDADLENGKKVLGIFVDNKLVAQADVTPQVYKNIFDQYVSAMPVLRADKNIVVNSAWGKGVIDLKNAKSKLAD